MSSFDLSPTSPLLGSGKFALRFMMALLITATAGLALIGAEVRSGALHDPELLALLH